MIEGTETEQTLDEQLHALAGPLHERLAQVEKEIRVAQTLTEKLRQDRTKVRAALRAVDPTFEPASKSGPKKKSDATTKPWSEDAVAQATELLEGWRGSLNGDEFTATEFGRRADWPFSSSYTVVLFKVLHDRGVLRLARRGKGGSRIYSVV